MRRSSIVAFVLVALGMARAIALVAHEPLVGYANQYDMFRTESCVGVFPATPAGMRGEQTPDAPVAIFSRAKSRGDCYGSTEVALLAVVDYVARLAGGESRPFHLRWIGYVKIALLATTAFLLAFALREHPAAALAHGAVVLLVMADPAMTLWFNTLYTEFWAGWGLYASIGALCALSLRAGRRLLAGLVACAGLAALAFSKEQFAMLAPVLAALAIPWTWRASPRWAVGIVIVSFCASMASILALPRHPDIRKMNRSHAYLDLLIPAADDSAASLQALGLPQSCLSVTASEWHQRRGRDVELACAGVYGLSNLAFLDLLPASPEALPRSVARVLPVTQQAVIPYLGLVEGRSFAGLDDLGRPGFSVVTSIDRSMPLGAYMTAILTVVLCGIAAFLAGARAWALRRPPSTALLLVALGGVTTAYCLATTVFGDGLTEPGRHFWAGQMTAIGVAIALVACIPAWLASREATRGNALAIAAITAGAIVASWLSVEWAKHQPIAIGVLDEPSCVVRDEGLRVTGWALSPFGVSAVEAAVDERIFPAAYGPEDSPRLHRIFPGYPDSARGTFAVSIPREVLPARGGTLRLRARARDGSVTAVDRCELSPRD